MKRAVTRALVLLLAMGLLAPRVSDARSQKDLCVKDVKFALKEKGPVSIRVYDVSGRLVRVLVDEIREAGSYEAVWDGANDAGRRTASGVYFCRMEAGDYERTVKMIQLR